MNNTLFLMAAINIIGAFFIADFYAGRKIANIILCFSFLYFTGLILFLKT